MKTASKLSWIIIACSIVSGMIAYPSMPEQVDSHWNAEGIADGSMSKAWGISLFPLIMVCTYLLLIILPKIDPKKDIASFQESYDRFIIMLLLFLLYIHSLTLIWNVGFRFNMIAWFLPGLGGLFYYIGIMLPKVKQNWFVGIRTPWTLKSTEVWASTHRLGGTIFKSMGLVGVIAAFVPCCGIWIFLSSIMIGTAYLFIFSIIEFRREKKAR